MDQGFWYVVDHGVTSEDQYPYTGQVMRYHMVGSEVWV